MAIHFRCEVCGKEHVVDDSWAGRRAECRCGTKLTVPIPYAVTEDDSTNDDISPPESIRLWEEGDPVEADTVDPRIAAARTPRTPVSDIPPFPFVVGPADRKKAMTAIIYGSFVLLMTVVVPGLLSTAMSCCCIFSVFGATFLSAVGGVLLIVGGINVLKEKFLGVTLIGLGATGIAAIPGASAVLMFLWYAFHFEFRGMVQAVTMATVFTAVPLWLGLWAYRLERRRREYYQAFDTLPEDT
ncbi:MAG: hypothetical protein D6741_11410 [Planctomycetota bacterium]|nr:MAG: hypothetical protein D6741_11410 [Planctomycetota bacterium]